MSMLVLILVAIAGVAVLALVAFVLVVRNLQQKAAAYGYPGVGAYLRATPRNDEEKRHAVDLTLKGGVLVLLGLFFPPMILLGLVPMYYGARKLWLVSLGLDLLDQIDHVDA